MCLHDVVFRFGRADDVEDEVEATEPGSGGVKELDDRVPVSGCCLAGNGLTPAALNLENDVLGGAHVVRVVRDDSKFPARQSIATPRPTALSAAVTTATLASGARTQVTIGQSFAVPSPASGLRTDAARRVAGMAAMYPYLR